MTGKDAVFLSPHKFVGGPGTPGRAGRQARAVSQPRAVGAGWRHGPVRQPGRRTRYDPDPVIREEGGTPGDRRVDPRRAGVRAQGGGRRRGDPPPRARPRAARAARRGARTRTSRSSATPRAERLADRLARAASSRAAAARELRRRRCSATCSGSRRAAAASAPARICTGSTRSTIGLVGADGRRVATGPHGREAGVHPARRSTTSSARTVFAYILDAVHLLAEHGWKLLPLYRFDPAAACGAIAPASPTLRRA